MEIHKLGKRPVRQDTRTLQFHRYATRKPGILPPIPDEVSWVTKVPFWPMHLNDRLGDCVPAAMAHMVEQWSFYAGRPVMIEDSAVLAAYSAIGGYVPGDPSTDNGCDMLTALNYWHQEGIGGHKIQAFMQVDPTNLFDIRECIQLFGNVFVGIDLPVTAQGANDWTVPDGGPFGDGSPGSWGGHCVPFDASSPVTHTCVTWGQKLKLSHNFGLDYVTEMYAVISPDWIQAGGLAPNRFNLDQLMADQAAI